MIIEKNNKNYKISNYPHYWKITLQDESLAKISFTITKKQCPTLDELKVYILKSNLFI